MSDVRFSVVYPDFEEAVSFHVALMRRMGESYYGLAAPDLLRSALDRPRMAARFEEVDLLRQAAHLLWGLIQDHPFHQGNKRTGVALAFAFLLRNGREVVAEQEEVVALGLGVANGRMDVGAVEEWLRDHCG